MLGFDGASASSQVEALAGALLRLGLLHLEWRGGGHCKLALSQQRGVRANPLNLGLLSAPGVKGLLHASCLPRHGAACRRDLRLESGRHVRLGERTVLGILGGATAVSHSGASR